MFPSAPSRCSRSAFLTLAAGVIAAAGLPAETRADPVAEFYSGKTMRMIIPTVPGGDYDLRARLVARHIGKHIPGNPSLVPQNMPGAVGIQAMNYMYKVAPQDGTYLQTVIQNLPMHQALGGEGVDYKAQDFCWVGNTTSTPNVINSWHTSGIKTIEDVRQRELVVGAPGLATTSVYYPLVANALGGTKFRIIAGYPGGAAVNIAMERGEVQGRGSNSWASWKSTKANWLKERKIHMLIQIGLEPNPEIEQYMAHKVPLLMDLASNEEDRRILRFLSLDTAIARSISSTPNVPAERCQALRRAFDAAMKDPQLLAEARKAGQEIEPMSGARVQEIVGEIVSTPKDVIERTNRILSDQRSVERAKTSKKK